MCVCVCEGEMDGGVYLPMLTCHFFMTWHPLSIIPKTFVQDSQDILKSVDLKNLEQN